MHSEDEETPELTQTNEKHPDSVVGTVTAPVKHEPTKINWVDQSAWGVAPFNYRDIMDNIRRTAERGRDKALGESNSAYVDLFQHIIDELERNK